MSQVIYQRVAGEGIVPVQIICRGHSSVGRAPALQAGGRRFDSAWLHFSKQKHCKALHACGVSSVRVQYPAKSPIGHPQDRFQEVKSFRQCPPSVASRGRYWCDSAHIATTNTPFPEKKLVALPLAHTHRCQATSSRRP